MAASPDAICPLWYKLDLFLDGRLRSGREVRIIYQVPIHQLLSNMS